MPDDNSLHRATRAHLGLDLEDLLDSSREAAMAVDAVTRPNGTTLDLSAFNDLFASFEKLRQGGEWRADRTASDAWLAPRVHASLRMDRSLASDKGIWHWLAVKVASEYVQWRWEGDKGVTDDRWWGPIHKQALARLWWGAELFRDGGDYGPVARAFERQDLINSYLHRPLVRCRSFALGILAVVAREDGKTLPARQINDLARVLNLCTAGSPPETRVDFQWDDADAFLVWAGSDADVPDSWEQLPFGPAAVDTTEASIRGGRELALHGLELAGVDLNEV